MTVSSPERPEQQSQPELTEEERKQLLEQAIERGDKRAESEVEMAKLFLANGKTEIAGRQLQSVIERYGGSAAAKEARRMLKGL